MKMAGLHESRRKAQLIVRLQILNDAGNHASRLKCYVARRVRRIVGIAIGLAVTLGRWGHMRSVQET